MKATVYSREGKKKGELVLNPEIYAARVNARLLELVHTAYAANIRRGTADTKTRKEVRGGGKKPWRQKGTGRARHGSTRSPIWKGGGVTFGPHPRDYSISLSQSMRLTALVSALSQRADQKELMILEDITLETPKTKEFVEIIKALPLNQKRTLYVVKDVEENLKRASRNVRNWVEIQRACDLSAYHIMERPKLLIQEGALPVIESRLSGTPGAVVEAPDHEASEAKPKRAAKPKRVAKVKTKAKSKPAAAKKKKSK